MIAAALAGLHLKPTVHEGRGGTCAAEMDECGELLLLLRAWRCWWIRWRRAVRPPATFRWVPCRALRRRKRAARSACGQRDRRGLSARIPRGRAPRGKRSEPPAVLRSASVAPSARLASG